MIFEFQYSIFFLLSSIVLKFILRILRLSKSPALWNFLRLKSDAEPKHIINKAKINEVPYFFLIWSGVLFLKKKISVNNISAKINLMLARNRFAANPVN